MVKLSGSPPFSGESPSAVANLLKTPRIEISSSLSSETKDLLKGLLRSHPDKRITINEIINHPALTSNSNSNPISEQDISLMRDNYIRNMGLSNNRYPPLIVEKKEESQPKRESQTRPVPTLFTFEDGLVVRKMGKRVVDDVEIGIPVTVKAATSYFPYHPVGTTRSSVMRKLTEKEPINISRRHTHAPTSKQCLSPKILKVVRNQNNLKS